LNEIGAVLWDAIRKGGKASERRKGGRARKIIMPMVL
jgi:hypothetical protein